MKTELEVRILNIDIKKIQQKLKSIGAKKIAERNMRRYVYDLSKDQKGNCERWIRLRDDGSKTTLTIKNITHDGIDGTQEVETEVADFEKMKEILELSGIIADAYQENNRISYKFKDAKIEIDSWPLIPPHLEIEADSQEKIEEVLKLLGYTLKNTTTMAIKPIYEKIYGIDLHKIKELKF